MTILKWLERLNFSQSVETMWEKEKLLIMSNFSFSHDVFQRLVLQICNSKGFVWERVNMSLCLLVIWPIKDFRRLGKWCDNNTYRICCCKSHFHILDMRLYLHSETERLNSRNRPSSHVFNRNIIIMILSSPFFLWIRVNAILIAWVLRSYHGGQWCMCF